MVGLDVAGAVREFRGLGDNWGQQGAGTVEASRQERAVAWRVLVSERVTAASTSLREEEGLLQEPLGHPHQAVLGSAPPGCPHPGLPAEERQESQAA